MLVSLGPGQKVLHLRSRVDRFLVATTREELIPNVIQTPCQIDIALPTCPCWSWRVEERHKHKSMFQIRERVIACGGLCHRVNDWWNSYEVVEVGTPSFRLAKKLSSYKRN